MTDRDALSQDVPPLDPSHGPVEPRPREPVFNIPGVVLVAIAIMLLVQAADSFVFTDTMRTIFLFHTAFIPARYGPDGEWGGDALWTPVTYSLVHGGWGHVLLNAFWLAAFGAIVARRMGWGRFVLFWIFSAVASAAVFLAFHVNEIVVMAGASGVVSACMGAAMRFAFSGQGGLLRHTPHLAPLQSVAEALTNRAVLAFLLIYVGINFLAATGFTTTAVDAGIAWEAHLGGMVFGFFALPLFERRARAV